MMTTLRICPSVPITLPGSAIVRLLILLLAASVTCISCAGSPQVEIQINELPAGELPDDDLFLFRPGNGAAWVARSNGDGTFTGVHRVGDNGSALPNGIAGYDLLSASDQVRVFDYDGDNNDDLFLYRPGNGAAWVARSNGDGTFTGVHTVGDNGSALPNGIAGYDLLSAADQVRVFDYDGDGDDDLFLYRPGRGAAWIASSNGDGTFTGVHTVGDNGSAPPNGIARYDLLSASDQVRVFDYNNDGNDDLFLYRPGRGAAWVARSNGDGTFTPVYAVGDNGSAPPNGIAGYDLLSASDQVQVFDYDGDGDDDLFLYRPGQGAAWIARSNGDGTFTGVHTVGDNGSAPPNGIAGYDLLSAFDQVRVFNYDGDGDDDLFLYRPGQGAAWIARSNGDGTFTGVHTVGDNGSAPPNGIAGYDLLLSHDQVRVFDYDGDNNDDLFLYRPGNGAAWVARSNGDGTFTGVHTVGDNGSTPPNGIAGYDMLLSHDQARAFDFDGGDNTTDDYITWAPTFALARLTEPASSDVSVVLTNDSPGTGGNVAFADYQDPWPVNTTATATTLALTLPADGSWVPFVIAGEFGSPSFNDKDTIIEAHQNTTSGTVLGTKALMVRVRKNANELQAGERDRFLLAWQQYRNKVGGLNYIVTQEMHRLASSAGDEAHMQPAFLTWHRAFLLLVERELQKIDPSVALHYWDWDAAAPNIFAEDFMGAPGSGGFIAEPDFSLTNPLLGWDTDLPFSSGELRRNVDDHTRDPAGSMKPLDHPVFASLVDQTDYGPTTPGFPVNSFSDDVEKLSHNPGHGWPCASGHLTSPNRSAADPLFFLLHSQIDREWAYWQQRYARHGSTAGGVLTFPAPQHYDNSGNWNSPGNTADPDFRQQGSFLDDGMWPWDGSSGGTPMTPEWRPPNQATGVGQNVPNSIPLVPNSGFPAARHGNLWPAVETIPLNRHMIDYMGKFRPQDGLGFSYVNIPY